MTLIAMFTNLAADDGETDIRKAQFLQGLGSSPPIKERHGGDGGGAIADYHTYPPKAHALRQLNPDLYVCSCWPTLRALLDVRLASTKIVFAGLVDLTDDPASRYDDNVFGFIDYGANLCAQWPLYLSQIAPNVKRAAVIYDVNSTQPNKDAAYMFIDAAKGNLTGTLQTALDKIDVRSNTLKDDIKDFAHCTGNYSIPGGGACTPGGLIVAGGTPMATIRKKIIKAAADNTLPAVYANRMYVKDGGLISRGTYTPDLYLKAGGYANQILNGMTPTPKIDITQTGKDPNHPAVFETAINLKTAQALGGNILQNAQAIRADLVIPLGP